MTELRMALVLLTYKQERYVAEALRSALGQDHHPLDIIVSDDASPDGTWSVIKQAVAQYSGPHRLILQRNESNLGLIGNLMQAVRLVEAPYLVLAAGDDISEPDRVSRIAACFSADPNTKLVTSDFRVLFANGDVGDSIKSWRSPEPLSAIALSKVGSNYVQGCVNAYSREVFDLFDNFIPELQYEEDHALPFRALLLGNAQYIDKPLVRYRLHSESITESWRSLDDPLSGQRIATNNVRGFKQNIADLDHLILNKGGAHTDLLDLRRRFAQSYISAQQDLMWQTPGCKGVKSLFVSTLLGKISVREGMKIVLKVNFTRLWAWYVRRNGSRQS